MKIRSYLPLLHITIEIPFIRIRTQLMTQHLEKMETIEYLVLEIQLWKWRFDIRLYDTYRSKKRRRDR